MCAEFVRTYYPSKKIHEEYFHINGKKEGEYKSYYINGGIEIICNYVNGKLEGLHRKYYSLTPLPLSLPLCSFVNNVNNQNVDIEDINNIDCKAKNNPNGKLFSNTYFINGIKHGIYEEHYRSGELSKTYHYINGELNGEYIEYNKEGCIIRSYHYVNGKKQ